MKKRKLFCLLLVGALAVASLGIFAGCGGEGNENRTTVMTVGMISTPSGKDDGNFNQNVYEGMLAFKGAIESMYADKAIELKDKVVTDASAQWDTLKPAVTELANQCDVVVCSGFQFAKVNEVATQSNFKNKQFILIDTPAEVACDNVASFTYAEQEGGFLAGMAAALETKSKKVGCVIAIRGVPSNDKYAQGFCMGVAYAKKAFNLDVEVPTYSDGSTGAAYVQATGAFDDQSKGVSAGNALLTSGADIIFVAAGGSGNGVYSAVKSNGNAKVIGCDADQYALGANGDKNIMLTCALKRMSKCVYNSLENAYYGLFKGGANNLMSASNDGIGYMKLDGHHQMSAATIQKIDAEFAKIMAGTLVIPDTNEGYLAFMAENGVANA